MNVAAHQEKDKKMGKKKRRQATDFKEAVCYLSGVIQGAAR